MSGYDPACGLTYAEWLKAKDIGVMEQTWNTSDQVRDGTRDDGVRVKETTDQLGNVTTEHADGRQDVTINLRG